MAVLQQQHLCPAAPALPLANTPGAGPLQPRTPSVPHGPLVTLTTVLAQRTCAPSLLPALSVDTGVGLSHGCTGKRSRGYGMCGLYHCPWVPARHWNGELVPLGHSSARADTSKISPAAEAGKGRRLSQPFPAPADRMATNV